MEEMENARCELEKEQKKLEGQKMLRWFRKISNAA